MTISKENALLDGYSDDFAPWEEASDQAVQNEQIEEALALERSLEFESELEQDENPRNYDEELEDKEEEAAPISKKRLKREMQAEALKRLEKAARTEQDFRAILAEWDRLDRNRERRERDHENLRGDVPLEYMAVADPRVIPWSMNSPTFRQVSSGNFLDVIFSCPYELHELPSNLFISNLIKNLSLDHKEVLYYLSVKRYGTVRTGAIRGQTDRNIRKLRKTIHKKLQRKMYKHLLERQKKGLYLPLRERQFIEEFEALIAELGKDAVIRRENTTKPRNNKAALDESKDDE